MDKEQYYELVASHMLEGNTFDRIVKLLNSHEVERNTVSNIYNAKINKLQADNKLLVDALKKLERVDYVDGIGICATCQESEGSKHLPECIFNNPLLTKVKEEG